VDDLWKCIEQLSLCGFVPAAAHMKTIRDLDPAHIAGRVGDTVQPAR